MALKVLIIGLVWPEPGSSAAGSRMMQLIEFFQLNNYSVIFASAAADSDYAADLDSLGIEKVNIELNSSSFDSFIQELQPSIVVYDRFMIEEQFGWRVRENCPDTLQILDTEDLHCLRAARQKALKQGIAFEEAFLLTEEVAKRELASIYRSDLSLIISTYEMELLKYHFKVDEALLCHLPFMLDPINDAEQQEWPSFEHRKHFISIGNFLHSPNEDAVLYLKNEIWPLIRAKLPDAELHVYGAYVSEKAKRLHDEKNGFIIKGRAENAHDVVRSSRVLLAPLRFGAGLKGKLVEAMQCGTPSIVSSVASESMHEDLVWPGYIEDDPNLFAQRAVNIYLNSNDWNIKQAIGAQIINSFYSKQIWNDRLQIAIQKVQSNLQLHRENNFTGNMLKHHSLASTKYMARWIEEKNK